MSFDYAPLRTISFRRFETGRGWQWPSWNRVHPGCQKVQGLWPRAVFTVNSSAVTVEAHSPSGKARNGTQRKGQSHFFERKWTLLARRRHLLSWSRPIWLRFKSLWLLSISGAPADLKAVDCLVLKSILEPVTRTTKSLAQAFQGNSYSRILED